MPQVRIILSKGADGNLCCEVKDFSNRGLNGNILIHISADFPDINKDVHALTNEWQTIIIENTPNTGKFYKVIALLTIDNDYDKDEQILRL